MPVLHRHSASRRVYKLSSLSMSALVLVNTILKHAMQKRLEFENAFRGLGMSKHFSPLKIGVPQPLQGRS